MAVARSPKFCSHAGCSTLTMDTYCQQHAPLHAGRIDLRGRADERGYDSRWQKVRRMFLQRNPLCVKCLERGQPVIATVAHHVISIDEGGPRLDQSNLMALCRDCHEVTHGRKREKRTG